MCNDVSDDATDVLDDTDWPNTRAKKIADVKSEILLSKLNKEDPEGDDEISLNPKTWKKEPKPEEDDSDGDAKELN